MSSSNNTLTKMDIIKSLADRHHLQTASTKRVVQGTLDAITEALIRGQKIELRNFGIFEVIERAARKARNLKARTEVIIPRRNVVKFRPGKIMEDKITRRSMKENARNTNEPPRTPDKTNPQ